MTLNNQAYRLFRLLSLPKMCCFLMERRGILEIQGFCPNFQRKYRPFFFYALFPLQIGQRKYDK